MWFIRRLLKAASFDGCSPSDDDFTYDDLGLGNIKTKNGSGEYLYGTNAGPHAVTSAYGLTYHYNANGGMTEATDSAGAVIKRVEYSAFNKPTLMTKGSDWSRVVYGPNKQRLKREDSTGRTRLYIGGLYEETERGGITERLHYVGDFAVYVEKVGLEQDSYHQYLHRDHLGSIVAKTTDKLPSLEAMANGAWGERRFMAWDGPADPDYDPVSARGFTNHEHLDPVGLIHMNGRVYDPQLGRFLSPDPLVQAPYNSQSYNRYSYVFNNPLSYTDPSGYQAEDDTCNGQNAGYYRECRNEPTPEEIERAQQQLKDKLRQQQTIGNPVTKDTIAALQEIGEMLSLATFTVEGGDVSDQNFVYEEIGAMLGTKEGARAYLSWVKEYGFEGKLVVDLNCSICTGKRVAAVQWMNDRGEFKTYLPTSVPSGLDYIDLLGNTGIRFTYSMLIAHEVFGHGFRRHSGDTHGHRDVIMTTNRIMGALVSGYKPQSTEYADVRRMGW